MRRLIFVVLILVLIMVLGPAVPGSAQTEPRTGEAGLGPVLFQNLRAGMARQEVAARPGVYDCSSGREPGALCLDGVEHLGRGWAADFAFDQDRLAAISLVRPFDPSLYLDAFAAITARSALVALQSDEGVLDVVRLLAQGLDDREFSDTITRFEERGMRSSRLAYVFLDQRSIAPLAGKAGDLATLTVWAGSGLVRTVLVLHGGATGTNKEGDWLAVVFEAPNHTLTQ